MKFTLSWLKDHLDTSASLDEIVDALTMIGLEVEAVDDRARFKPFTIAKVLTAEQHPDADKLRVLSVDTGSGTPVQVVCGAPNARAGLIGAFAGPGTYVPGIDLTLGTSSIRGVESSGMMCSERELELSDNHEGIIDLPEDSLTDAPVGSSFAAYAGLDDPVIEIAVTPNRPDCLGVYGIARDLAAAGLGTLKDGSIAAVEGKGACPVSVSLEFSDTEPLCPAFGLRLISGIQNCTSPQWLRQRLTAIGLRPINALVDITNFITFDRGRPLHVFDADKVNGDLVVRRGKDGEEIVALDGKSYQVNPDICVIADDKELESIAGVMGGEASGCSQDTTNVLIESALWEPLNIARTGRDLGIHSDARFRFERGVDPAMMLPGLELATRMVLEFCGGEPSNVLLAGAVPAPAKTVDFPYSDIQRLTGLDVPRQRTNAILESLGFPVSGSGDSVQVSVPSWRPDVDGKADIVEEVMRIVGVNEIAHRPIERGDHVQGPILTLRQTRERRARRALASRGMMEAVTWSFLAKDQAEAFGGGQRELALANPISSDLSDMRPSLLPNLISALQRNGDRGINNLALFEVGQIFTGDQPDAQKTGATGVRRGAMQLTHEGRDWRGAARNVDAFDAKADAFGVLAELGAPVANLQVVAEAPAWYHPGRSGRIQLGPKQIFGTFGELHPAILKQFDVDGPVVGFEIILENLPAPRAKTTRTKAALDLPELLPVSRDFAFVVSSDVSADKVLKAARSADKKLIRNVAIFDVYEGGRMEPGQKSLAIEVTLQPRDKTLTDEDISAVSAAIVASVEKATGGRLRG
uniref:phenylalanine--tRNA ligase subunit beta n=1 Tax=Pararhizobium sp. IMCC3301 TaxID=3067904 RepID=UPI002740BBAE|nr:phenylalanine--tRNA ligase subunit beta [Pararhizobium sp. IMCC3301]